jgi:hypothetical protein
MFAGFDDACCDLHPHRRNGLHLTDNDVAISRIESKLLEPLRVTGRPFTLPILKKNCLAGFAAIE